MTHPAGPGLAHAVLWGRGVQIGVGVVTLLGLVLVGYAAAQSSGTAQVDEQVDLATTGLVGLGLVVVALTAWVLLGRRHLMRTRTQLARRARAGLDLGSDRPGGGD